MERKGEKGEEMEGTGPKYFCLAPLPFVVDLLYNVATPQQWAVDKVVPGLVP